MTATRVIDDGDDDNNKNTEETTDASQGFFCVEKMLGMALSKLVASGEADFVSLEYKKKSSGNKKLRIEVSVSDD